MFCKNTAWKRIFSACVIFILLFGMALPVSAEVSLASAPLSVGNTQNGMVRVRLSSLGNPSSLKLTVNGSYTVNGKTEKAIPSGSVLQVSFSSSTGQLKLTQNGTTTNMGTSFKLRRHATDGSNGIKIAQGRVPANLYPGDFEFISQKSSSGYTLYVIVHVYIEDYLYGVVPYEMGNSSGLEALKAQAVAARTYTIRAMNGASSKLYDVVDTPSDQVYSGTPSGNANCKAAVDATKGIVSKNGSAFTATYYSASNGGQTESIKNIWGSTSHTYLKVKDDPYDLANPAAKKNSFTVNKTGTQSSSALQSLLNNKASAKFGTGAKVTGVTAIRLHTPKYASPSKLYTKADFSVKYTQNGSSSNGTVTFDIFSELESPLGMSINSGSNELWSVDETTTGFTVYARRYGHGLGMSQRGAMYMAQIGYTYDQILAFYFEGCKRVQYNFTRSILSPVVGGQDSSEEIIVETPADIEQDNAHEAQISASGGTPLLSGASGNASSLTQLPKGAKVQVCEASGSYYLVTYGSLCGYVAKDALDHDGTVSGSQIAPTVLYGYGKVVNSNALNLRTAPSMKNSTVLTTVPGKYVLPVFSVSGNWAYVQYGLRVGYVSMDYIDFTPADDYQPSIPTPVPVPEEEVSLQARVTTVKGSLNLREKAVDGARILTQIPQYTVIQVKERTADWCEVNYKGYHGYVMTKYLTFIENTQNAVTPSPKPTQAPSANLRFAMVTTEKGSLNLRSGKSSTARVLDTIPQYEIIQVHAIFTDWYQVTYNGITGYVMSKYMTLLEAQPAFTPLPTQKPAIEVTPKPTSTPQPVTPPATQAQQYARVTTAQGSLNLREVVDGRVLRTIPQYETVTVLQRGSSWCKVWYMGTTGYVMTKFLTFLNAQPVQTPAPATAKPTLAPVSTPVVTGQTAIVTTQQGSLNLRKTANGMVLCTIPQYETVTVLSKGSTWSKVSYMGITGYVMTKYLTFTGTAQQATPKPAPTKAPVSGNGNIVCYATVKTASGSLNLRMSADVDATVISQIPQYEKIPVYQKGTVWCKVAYNGVTGYVLTSYLSFDSSNTDSNKPSGNQQSAQQPSSPSNYHYIDPTMETLDEPILGKVISQSSSLNMRAYCSTDAEILTEIPKNVYVLITKVGDDWCEVIHENYTGYCMEKYLEYAK